MTKTVNAVVTLDTSGGMYACQFDHDGNTYFYQVLPCGRLTVVGWASGSDTAKAAAMTAFSQFLDSQGVSA